MIYEHAMMQLRAVGRVRLVRRDTWPADEWVVLYDGALYMRPAAGGGGLLRPWAPKPEDVRAGDWRATGPGRAL